MRQAGQIDIPPSAVSDQMFSPKANYVIHEYSNNMFSLVEYMDNMYIILYQYSRFDALSGSKVGQTQGFG